MTQGGAYSLDAWAALPLTHRQAIVQRLAGLRASDIARVLGIIRAPRGYGVFASGGPLYSAAIFGRDSIFVADNLLGIAPDLSKEIILLLARLQGLKVDLLTEEEPGKIHHEYRLRHFADMRLGPVSHKVLDELAQKWSGTQNALCYYGSVDATPLFVRLVGRYCERYGRDVLHESVIQRDNQRRSLAEVVHASLDWIEGQIRASSWQLLEFRRRNQRGLYNQSWQDSNTAYLHLDGSTANADDGIASVEVQGYAYDALLTGAELFGSRADQLQTVAARIQEATLSMLWMPDNNYFAAGLDRDGQGRTRRIETLNVNAAVLLASSLFDSVNHKSYIKSLAEMVMSEEFLTDVGVRVRARRHRDLLPYADYHGCYVAWPKVTFEVASGLRRHGYASEASLLEKRMQHGIIAAGEFYEFFLVDSAGKAKYHYRQIFSDEPQFHDLGAANQPEPGQAWTLSAYLASFDIKLTT